MDAASKPSSVSSRFVSQTELSEAQRRREDEVRATYARLGQSPPPEALAAARRENEEYDPRSLFERLQANKDAKQEAFDEKMKLSNQFRGIDDGESEFLAEVAREKRKAERKKEEEMRKELDEFRKAALSKEASPPRPALAAGSTSPPPLGASSSAVKNRSKRKREGLLGVVRKKSGAEGRADSKADRVANNDESGKGESDALPATEAAVGEGENKKIRSNGEWEKKG